MTPLMQHLLGYHQPIDTEIEQLLEQYEIRLIYSSVVAKEAR